MIAIVLPVLLKSVTMKTLLMTVVALALTATAAPASQSPPMEMVGTFQCVNHVSGGTVIRFTATNTIYGPWLRVSTVFHTQSPETALTFLGYDSGSKRWNIVSVNSAGSYFTRNSTSVDVNGSHWVDADPKDGGRAVLSFSPQQWTFDLVVPGAGTSSVHSHVICTRAQ